ncbi:hypothetical protein B4064_2716 [Caldibacillus thermoamylovorans]|uniref:Uncharacterized protein n=1 Tax=Caldibacillus thermoamylovorans TaxID=35841 RepID=A0ABD4A6I9_9BACI|nr:hypothetical protein B4166_3683 [Caldibacillus thermoamylovorans]KIO64796.1 hypothetical protein B4064_2716 [Caldibacillus thermoamylovorans]KIO72671.1 hypothetical protein B4167_2808 [Caldibacillus thermoamylovorans]
MVFNSAFRLTEVLQPFSIKDTGKIYSYNPITKRAQYFFTTVISYLLIDAAILVYV